VGGLIKGGNDQRARETGKKRTEGKTRHTDKDALRELSLKVNKEKKGYSSSQKIWGVF